MRLLVIDMHQWLPRLCWSTSPNGRRFQWAQTPCHVTCHGQDWTVATDSRGLVAFAGRLASYSTGGAEADLAVASVFKPETVWRETIALDLVRRWCGPPEFDREIAEARRSEFLGLTLDLNLVGCFLAGVEAETVKLGWKASGAPLVIEPELAASAQPPWKVLVMPMVEHAQQVHEVPLLGADSVDATWLAWQHGALLGLARDIAKRKAFELLPILGDALEEAGCAESAFLAHCRRPGLHHDSCWLVDLLITRGSEASG
jgi:hypothetical protein